MKKIGFIFLILWWATFAFGQKTVTLPTIENPLLLKVDQNQIYINDGITLNIYSKKDFSLKKRFGTKGEGPQEFNIYPGVPLHFDFKDINIVVFSIAKVSFYTKDGNFVKEMKTTNTLNEFQVLGDKFVGTGFGQDANSTDLTINLYDPNMKKLKQLYSIKIEKGKKTKILDSTSCFRPYNGNVFICSKKEYAIDVFDSSGDKLYSIEHKYKNLPLTPAIKEKILNWYKTNPVTKKFFDQMKASLEFPTHLPAVRNFTISGNRLYVQTFQRNEGKTLFHIFDIYGKSCKFIKELWLPIVRTNPIEMQQLFAIHRDTLFQLVEVGEEWQLQITPISSIPTN